MTAFVANTNLLELVGLKAAVDGEFINDATVEVTVRDDAGAELAGASWPLTMDYVADLDGEYRAALADDLPFLPMRYYTAEISADAGANRVGSWTFAFQAQTRG